MDSPYSFIIYGRFIKNYTPLTYFTPYQGKELKKNDRHFKAVASNAADDVRVAAHAAYDRAKVATHNVLKDAEYISDDAKIGVHKTVSDAKIAAHEAGSELKMR